MFYLGKESLAPAVDRYLRGFAQRTAKHMKLNQLFKQKKIVFSFEIFPPKKDSPVRTIYRTLENLGNLEPDFISVTYGAGGNLADNSTCEIASIIKNQYGIEPLAHLTCVNSSREEIGTVLSRLQAEGIENILALRGDISPNKPPKTDFRHASDLADTITAHGGFNVVGACYPEGHSECGGLEQDVENLRHKVEAGATHLITQLFFDNGDFYKLLDLMRQKNINVPVQAGIMPIVSKSQIERTVSMCGASIPKKFVKMVSRYANSPEALYDAGIAYAVEQMLDLIANGAQGLHLYTMNKPEVAKRICDGVGSIIRCENGQ